MMISVAFLLSVLGQIHIDEDGSVFRDQYNRTLIWHGTNFVEKGAPYYPTISAADKDAMVIMGFKVVRLGVMMPGLFPVSLEPNATYLDEIERIVDDLWSIGIHSNLDLHQDVLSPVICGEGNPCNAAFKQHLRNLIILGTPSWMLNTSQLRALNFPQPLVLSPSFKPDPATGGWQPGVTCSPEGVLKFIGWSEFYMTDGWWPSAYYYSCSFHMYTFDYSFLIASLGDAQTGRQLAARRSSRSTTRSPRLAPYSPSSGPRWPSALRCTC